MGNYIDVDKASLLKRLNTQAFRALEDAGGWAFSRTHYEVTPAHLLSKLVEDRSSDVPPILSHYGVDTGRLTRELENSLERQRTGSGGELTYSPSLIDWITDAWLLASVDFKQPQVRSGTLLLAALLAPQTYFSADVHGLLSSVSAEKLREQLLKSNVTSVEENEIAAAAGGDAAKGGAARDEAKGFLARFTNDFTAAAREGRIDPVFGRDHEIRQMLDILARRRKNNPIVVGEAGVGKTAVVEGLALRMVEGDVPDVVKGGRLLSLDLGLLQAGASVKGEFEKRLQGVIDEVKASPTRIILFIDEAHTLIGAGGQAGGSDAANLLKPALARGELRTIAATTWAEYKKYFEKDPALSRRFQLVKLEEPDDDTAALILRGVRGAYEASHGVTILDSAVQAAANLATRYISGRQHPDKGVDLLDTATARVNIAQKARPARLDDLDRRVASIKREVEARDRDRECNVEVDEERLKALRDELAAVEDSRAVLHAAWRTEHDQAHKVLALRTELQAAKSAAPAEAGRLRSVEVIRAELRAADRALAELQKDEILVPVQVDERVIAATVSDWTGIPLGNMIRDEAETLLRFEDLLGERIKGQRFAIDAVANGIRTARAGIENPSTPNGVFLFVGPSGVGKTEMALTVADLLYGGEQSVVSINMSEFQEPHTVSRLVGSPPGYVGYGEGGVLTEAVRKRPYSVVLFDETEKAHKQVANIFYQIFDKGMLADGEGRIIDFKNTTIFLTSNLGTEIFHSQFEGVDGVKSEDVVEAIRPALKSYFAPALLGRMTVVPFLPLSPAIIDQIVRLKLGRLGKRLQTTHRMAFDYDVDVVSQIASRCTEVESGARNIDHIIAKHLNPILASAILRRMGEGQMPAKVRIVFAADKGAFDVQFSGDMRKVR